MIHPVLVLQQQKLFDQLSSLLASIDEAIYAACLPLLQHNSIGQHVRHIVELFEELDKGYAAGVINYDKRKHDKVLEQHPQAAISRMAALQLLTEKPDKQLSLCGEGLGSGNQVSTNYARELIYNIEHTVHHMAIIRIAVEAYTDIKLPADFGVAASTINYRQQCAQ